MAAMPITKAVPTLGKDEIMPAIRSHAEHLLGYAYAAGKSDFYPTQETVANIEQIAKRIQELAQSLK